MIRNTQNITYIAIRIRKHNNKKYVIYTVKQKHTKNTTLPSNLGSAGPYLVFASYTKSFALQLRKKHGNPSVRVKPNLLVRQVKHFYPSVALVIHFPNTYFYTDQVQCVRKVAVHLDYGT
jgi:hypothetical protein